MGAPSAISCQVQARFGPKPPRCIYTVSKAKLPPDVCGEVCDSCPHARGDLICANSCPNGEDECAARLTGINACANGAACKIVAYFTACAEAPGNCDPCTGGHWGAPPELVCRINDAEGKAITIKGTYDIHYNHPIVIEKLTGEDQWDRLGDEADKNDGVFTWSVPRVVKNGWLRAQQGTRVGETVHVKYLPTCK